MIGHADDVTNFPHKLQFDFCKGFTDESSANIISKMEQYKIMQFGHFLSSPSLAKSVLIPLGLITAADAGIHKTILRLRTTADNFKQKK